MSDPVFIALVTAACSFIGSWAAVQWRLKTLTVAVNSAHRRLNLIGAPASDSDPVPE